MSTNEEIGQPIFGALIMDLWVVTVYNILKVYLF